MNVFHVEVSPLSGDRDIALETWTKAYPKSEWEEARLKLYLSTYEALWDRVRVFETCRQPFPKPNGETKSNVEVLGRLALGWAYWRVVNSPGRRKNALSVFRRCSE